MLLTYRKQREILFRSVSNSVFEIGCLLKFILQLNTNVCKRSLYLKLKGVIFKLKAKVILKIVRNTNIITICIIILSLGFLYVFKFETSFLAREWEKVGKFTRIIVPDTLLYRIIADDYEISNGDVFNSGKNMLVPVLLWKMVAGNYYLALLVNIGFLFGIIKTYFDVQKLLNLQNPLRNSIVVLFSSPVIIFYSIGMLKELPSAFFLLFVTKNYLKGRNILFIFSSMLLVAVRYQYGSYIVLLLSHRFFKRFTARSKAIVFFALMVFYPAFKGNFVFQSEATALYRQEFKTDTIGGRVEEIRDNIYVLSSGAIIFRTLQTVFEPLITLFKNSLLFEDGYLSLNHLVETIFSLGSIPVMINFLRLSGAVIVGNQIRSNHDLSFDVLIMLILVGGFSFIHYRYIMPFMPLIFLFSGTKIVVANLNRKSAEIVG